MKAITFMTVLFLILVSSLVSAQDQGLGLGVILGDPVGITGKAWISPENAVQVELGWDNQWSHHYTWVNVDYLWHSVHAIRSSERFPLYYGVGGVIGGGGDNMSVGIRGVGGIAWWDRHAPIELFLEVAPVLYFSPSIETDLNAGIGIRYFF